MEKYVVEMEDRKFISRTYLVKELRHHLCGIIHDRENVRTVVKDGLICLFLEGETIKEFKRQRNNLEQSFKISFNKVSTTGS